MIKILVKIQNLVEPLFSNNKNEIMGGVITQGTVGDKIPFVK